MFRHLSHFYFRLTMIRNKVLTHRDEVLYVLFADETISFSPDLIVVSGFHLLDSQGDQFWSNRITEAATGFSRLPRTVPVHLELASMTHCPVVVAIMKQLFHLVNSIGLNEQELTFISRCVGGIHADLTAVKKQDEIGKIQIFYLLQAKNSLDLREIRTHAGLLENLVATFYLLELLT